MSGQQSYGDDRGFAAVDALVALTILATTIVLALQAFSSARRVASSALETARATAELRFVMDGAAAKIGVKTGKDEAFAWRTDTRRLPFQITGVALCRRDATATARRTGRRYRLQTLVFCRPLDPKA